MKKVKFEIDKSKQNPISAIALVDAPAIESDFTYFNNQNKKKYFKKEGFEQCVQGMVLIPDKDILRESNGKYFVATFSKEVVKELSKLFFKNENNNSVNINHSTEDAKTYVFESFIIDSEERQKDVIAKGVPEADAVIGGWYATMQIEDKDVFQKVVDGELNGFSIEAWLKGVLVEVDDEENNFSKTVLQNMSNKIDKMIAGLKALLSEVDKTEEKKETKLESAKTADGKAIEYGAEKEAVNEIAEDGTKKALADGTHVLDNGKQIEVKDGLLVSIADAPKEEEAKKEEPAKVEAAKVEPVQVDFKALQAKFGKSVYANYTLEDGKEVQVTVSEINEVYSFDEAYNRSLLEKGEYSLKDGGKLVVGDGGKFVSVDTANADINAQPEAELQKQLASIKTQLEAIQKETEKVKSENEVLKNAPLAKPIVKTEDFKKKKVNYTELSNADKMRYDLGILN